MKRLYPDAVVSYDLSGVKKLDYVGTFQGEESEEFSSLLREQYETGNADSLISFLIDCASCLDHGDICRLEDLQNLRGDWTRIQWGVGGDYLIFKQLSMDLYSLYIVCH